MNSLAAIQPKRPLLLLVAVLTLLLPCLVSQATAGSAAKAAKPGYSLEGAFALGYTVVDMDGWARNTNYDWGQFAWRGTVAGYRWMGPKVQLGVEGGTNYFFWYTYRTYSGYESSAVDVDAWHVMAMGRVYLSPRVFAEVGGGYFFFSDFSDPGVVAGLGYRIPVSERLSVPIKARAGMVLDSDANVIPLTLSGGITLDF
jgi:hypothetical protein